MNIEFLRREYKKGEMDKNSIIPLYLLTVREQHPQLWRQFVNMINMIDDGRYEKYLKENG